MGTASHSLFIEIVGGFLFIGNLSGDLEMDILIIVTHMFLSFFKMPFDGSTFFLPLETKQSCGFRRVTKTQN